MRALFGLVLIAGLGLAGFAVYLARDYFSNYQVELAQERAINAQVGELTTVFVVNRQVKYGERLTKADVDMLVWPKKALPEGAFETGLEMFPEDEKELRTVLRTMEKGEVVMAIKVTAPGEDAGITSRLAKGMRAFTIKVDVTSGVSGFLRPGDTVDVYWTGQVRGMGMADGDITQLIQANVSLIAVDQTADGDRNGASIARTITVEISPQTVARLAQAQTTGRLSLSLVGSGDESVAQVSGVDQNQLLGIQRQEIAEVVQEQICTIKTRKGAEVVEIPIPCTN